MRRKNGPGILYSSPFSASSGSDFLIGIVHMPHPLLHLGLSSQGSFYILASGPTSIVRDQEGVPLGKDGQAPAADAPATGPKVGREAAGPQSGLTSGEGGSTTKEGTTSPGQTGKKAPPEMCGNTTLLMMGGMFVIVYFLMLRPQQKQEKARKAMLAELGKGDKIVTSSGIHCEIVSVHAEEGAVTVKFGNEAGQRFKIDRTAISRVQGGDAAPEKKG